MGEGVWTRKRILETPCQDLSYGPHYASSGHEPGPLHFNPELQPWSTFNQDCIDYCEGDGLPADPGDLDPPPTRFRSWYNSEEQTNGAFDDQVAMVINDLRAKEGRDGGELAYKPEGPLDESQASASRKPDWWQTVVIHEGRQRKLVCRAPFEGKFKDIMRASLQGKLWRDFHRRGMDERLKKAMKQIISYMVEGDFKYGGITTYDRSWFLCRPHAGGHVFLVTDAIHNSATAPTIRQALYYWLHLTDLDDAIMPNLPRPEEQVAVADISTKAEKSRQSLSKFRSADVAASGGGGVKTRSRQQGKNAPRSSKTAALQSLAASLPDLDSHVNLGNIVAVTALGAVRKIRTTSGCDAIAKTWDAFQPGCLQEAAKEASALLQLEDTGVAPKFMAFGWAEHKSQLVLMMEKLHGHPFQVGGESKSVRDAAWKGLCAMHSKRILHGDLDPTNIIVIGPSNVRFIDFGAALLMAPATELANEKQLMRDLMIGSP